MTFIQHNRSNWWQSAVMAALIVFSIGASVELVYLYNRAVNLKANVAAVREDIQDIETQNAEMKEQIFGLLSPDNFQEFAAERGLVQENSPRYLEVDRKWSIASQR